MQTLAAMDEKSEKKHLYEAMKKGKKRHAYSLTIKVKDST